jgi:hypothetical protein
MITPIGKRVMYNRIPQESWLTKGLKTAEQGLKLYGTVKGLYDAGTAIAGGMRVLYQGAAMAAPVLAVL